MSQAVEGNILRNTALFYHLFQWFTDVPIVEIGKYKFVLLESLISPDYLQWNIQQLHLEIDLCFVALRKHSKKCTFYTLRFGCSFAAVNTIKPQLL